MGFEFSIMTKKGVPWTEEFDRRTGYEDMMEFVEELDNAGAPIDLVEKLENNSFILTSQECRQLYEILLNVAVSMKYTGEDEGTVMARYDLIKTFKLGAENDGLSCH